MLHPSHSRFFLAVASLVRPRPAPVLPYQCPRRLASARRVASVAAAPSQEAHLPIDQHSDATTQSDPTTLDASPAPPSTSRDGANSNLSPASVASHTPSDIPKGPHTPADPSAHDSPTVAADAPPPPSHRRFDWRGFAPSRTRTPVPAPQTPESARPLDRVRYTKRVPPPYADVRLGEPWYEEIKAYSARFLPMLAAEQAQEEEVLKRRLSTWSLDRLRKEGYCLTDLSSFWLESTHFGRPVASFSLGPGIVLPEHRFENGTQVLVSRIDPMREQAVEGSIVSKSGTQLRVSFEKEFPVADGAWRLDVGSSNAAYTRMRDAIAHLNLDPRAQEAEGAAAAAAPDGTADREVILQGTHLRDVILRSFGPPSASAASADPESAPEADAETDADADAGAPHAHAHVPLQAPDDAAYPAPPRLDHGAARAGAGSGSVRGGGGAFRDDMRIQSWARRHACAEPLSVEGDPELGLNAAQTRAIAMMVGERVSLVQGPPGTGKTRTIIEAVKLLKVHFQVPHPLLVCTYTNVAVDNLVEGLAAAGLRPLRVGFGGKVKPALAAHTLAAQLAAHARAPALAGLARDAERLGKRAEELGRRAQGSGRAGQARREACARALAGVERQVGAVRARMYALEQVMLREVLARADVVCTTCITAACADLRATDFPVVFLDEASMSTEPASLIPLMKGAEHVALIGDHKQLPPVITSEEAQANGLGISLFERLTEEGEVPTIMLDVQYRMHPAISRFPSGEFYGFRLRDGVLDARGNVPAALAPPVSASLGAGLGLGRALELGPDGGERARPSVVFLDHTGNESMKDRSRVNWNEAHIVCSVVEDLLLRNEDIGGADIGIIAPYVAQIALLTRLLTADAGYAARFGAVLGARRAAELAHVEVKTVDGFEGREKAVVVFSTVRNNAGGHIGFLADRRRLNVGLTRARRGLFVVGSLSTLGAGGRRAGVGEAAAAATAVAPGAGADQATVVSALTPAALVSPASAAAATAAAAKAHATKAKRTAAARARGGRGAEAWERYAQFLTREGLVLRLVGARLAQTLYGNLPRELRGRDY